MTKKMLIDVTHDEETRVAIVDGHKLLEFDYESKFRKPLKGSIFLAKVTRVEPSLQAAFVNFGGNRHGFLPFSEIHPDYFRIPIADREALLAEQQAAIEEMAKEEEAISADLARQEDSEPSDAAPDLTVGGPVEEIEDEKDAIEEVGGQASIFDSSAEVSMPEGDAFQDESEEDSFAQENAEDDQAEEQGEPNLDADGNPVAKEGNDGEKTEGGEEGGRNDGRGGRGGRGRFRRGGRRGGGNGRGRHRAAHSSRRVESFGGEDYDDEGGDHFRFSLRRKYKIQEVIKRGQIMLVQVSKEERGNKGAAVSTYLSLPGRYCVLMPNSPRAGGVSRKIASHKDRARMREIVKDLEVPQGMSVIVRTAGVARSKAEIKRDLDYLMRLWDNIRELTLQSSAPAMVYEEADLIKRAVRDLYGPDIEDVIVAGTEGFNTARNFMTMLVPSHTDKVIEYTNESMPLFHKYKVEEQIAEIGESQVTLPSGGYLVINQTEALVAIDVNSGKATKERHIEETALKTNLESATELARQLRLRDLGGLIVVDFIDMEDRRNNAKVERRMREALSGDRARIQMGRISSFGLMELSRQRLNPSLTEAQFEICQHCVGTGRVRTCDATSVMVLRALEEEGIKGRAKQAIAHVSNEVAIYILNNKRRHLIEMEKRYGLTALIRVDENVGASSFRIEVVKTKAQSENDIASDAVSENLAPEAEDDLSGLPLESEGEVVRSHEHGHRSREPREGGSEGRNAEGRRRRGRRGGRGRNRPRDGEGGGRSFERHNNNPGNVNDAGVMPYADDQVLEPQGAMEGEDDSRGNREEYNRSRHDFSQRDNNRGGRGRGGRGRDGGRNGGRNNNRRPPRDENFNGRSSVPNKMEAYEPPQPASYESAPAVTPAPMKQQSAPAPAKEEKHARIYEKVNEAPKEKKRGWWSKGE